MPPRDDAGGATLLCANGDGAMPSSRRESARCWQRWRDAIIIMESWCEAAGRRRGERCCEGVVHDKKMVIGAVKVPSTTW
jgi:hypothetical protein